MPIRLSRPATVIALALICAASARAATYTIRKGDMSGPPVYSTLADFQAAMDANPAMLRNGDVIELHNDDNSLAMPLLLPGHLDLTLRGVGGRYTFDKGIEWISPPAGTTLTLDNIRLAGNTGTGLFARNKHIVIRNSVVENGANPGLEIIGDSRLDVIVDGGADAYTHWTSDGAAPKALIASSGLSMTTVDMDFSVAGGKTLALDGDIASTNNTTTIAKTGDGVLKLNGNVVYTDTDPLNDSCYNTLDIREGTVHFGDTFVWRGFDVSALPRPDGSVTPVPSGTIHVGANGTFKPSITAGDLEAQVAAGGSGTSVFNADFSRFVLGRFTSDQGARLEVGGISSMPFIGDGRVGNTSTSLKIWYQIADLDPNGAGSNVAGTLSISNSLMDANLEIVDSGAGGTPVLQLNINRVENLSSLEGVGDYADVYRRMANLSEAERDMLDAIYATGGGVGTGFLQTIGGQIVQNSLLALRHNQANLLAKINTRLTKYQKEELELTPEVTGSDFLYNCAEDPVTRYGELWAAIDQTWMKQQDIGDMAGYNYDAATLTVGYDRHWDNMIAGGAMNYASGTMKLRSAPATRTELDSLIAAVYASWAMDGWYVSGSLFAGYGWNESESDFSLSGLLPDIAGTGTYATSGYGANAEFGYMMETHLAGIPLRVTPYGGLTYARMHRDAVREGGGGALDRQFRAAVWNAWDAALGVRVSVPMEGDGYYLVPSIDLAWTRTMGSPETTGGDAYFVSDPSSAWNIPFMTESRNSLRLAAGVDARFRNNVTVAAGYELEWRDRFWKHQLNMAASMEF